MTTCTDSFDPCPFCDSDKISATCGDDDSFRKTIHINCDGCGARMTTSIDWGLYWRNKEHERFERDWRDAARKKWNRRPTSDDDTKIKTVSYNVHLLRGRLLDWAVCIAEGATLVDHYGTPKLAFLDAPEVLDGGKPNGRTNTVPEYSSNLVLASAIIDREGIASRPHVYHNNVVTSWSAHREWPLSKSVAAIGNTRLEACMKCYVCYKLGLLITIPLLLTVDGDRPVIEGVEECI